MIALLAGSWHRHDKFAVFLADKILGRIGSTAISSFFSITNHELFRRLKVEANFSAGRGILWRARLLCVVWGQIYQLDLGNFVARSVYRFDRANAPRTNSIECVEVPRLVVLRPR